MDEALIPIRLLAKTAQRYPRREKRDAKKAFVKSTNAGKATSSRRIERLAFNVAIPATSSPTKRTSKLRSCNRITIRRYLVIPKATNFDLATTVSIPAFNQFYPAATRAGLAAPIKDNLNKSNIPAIQQPPRPSFDLRICVKPDGMDIHFPRNCTQTCFAHIWQFLHRNYNLYTIDEDYTVSYVDRCTGCDTAFIPIQPTSDCAWFFTSATISPSRIFPDTNHDPTVPTLPCPRALAPTSRNIPGKAHKPDMLFFVRA